MEKKTLQGWGGVKIKFDKWRVLILVFLAIYLIFLLLNLGSMAVQWDEASHLDGGFLLLHGHLNSYMATDSFYPPLEDLITAGYFAVAGLSVFVGRLVAVTFAALTVLAVFEFAYRVYGPRTAFVSAVLPRNHAGHHLARQSGNVGHYPFILLFRFDDAVLLVAAEARGKISHSKRCSFRVRFSYKISHSSRGNSDASKHPTHRQRLREEKAFQIPLPAFDGGNHSGSLANRHVPNLFDWDV